MQQLTPSLFSEWVSEPVRLPSGKVAELHRPDLVDLMVGGEIPDLLTNIVMAQIKGEKMEGFKPDTPEKMRELNQTLNIIAMAAFVSPRLWDKDDIQEPYIPVRFVSFQDKAFVMTWALGAHYEKIESFREEQAGDVEPVPAVQDVPARAKRRAGTRV